MQTIARANRVTSWKINGKEKKNGEIVDYYNVFRNMRKALKDYAQGQEGQEDLPVREKDELFKLLDDAIVQGKAFCAGLGIDLDALFESKDVFKNVGDVRGLREHAADARTNGGRASLFTKTPSPASTKPANRRFLGGPIVRAVAVFQYLRGVLDAIIEQTDIDAVALRVGELLDESLSWSTSGMRSRTASRSSVSRNPARPGT